MNKKFKKVISSVLAAVMTMGVVGVANVSSVFAEGTKTVTRTWTNTQNDDNFINIPENTGTSTKPVSALGYTDETTITSTTTGTKVASAKGFTVTADGEGTLTIYAQSNNNDNSTTLSGAATNPTTNTITVDTTSNGVVASKNSSKNKTDLNPVIFTLSGAGTYTITNTGKEILLLKMVMVTTVSDEDIDPTGISITPATATTYVDNTTTLTATREPANATGTIEWSSSDDSIATVANGTVTGVSAGKATITAKLGNVSSTSEITVLPTPVITPSNGTSIDDLVAATKTTTYNFLTTATDVNAITDKVIYLNDNLYFDNEVFIANAGDNSKGLYYYAGKNSYNLEETTPISGGIRLKAGQDVFAVKLSAGSTIEVPVNGGGSGDRYAIISTSATTATTDDALAATENIGTTNGSNPQTLTYTNETGADQVVYVTATLDSFFSQVKVTVPDSTPEIVKADVNKVAYVKDGDNEYAVAIVGSDEADENSSFYLTDGTTAKTSNFTNVYSKVTLGENTYSASDLANDSSVNAYLYGFNLTGENAKTIIASASVAYNK
jgi:hypothetical protein